MNGVILMDLLINGQMIINFKCVSKSYKSALPEVSTMFKGAIKVENMIEFE